ncbi:MAG: hypothetical protein IPN65_06835 [Elusimicrobia bacterium]|mgnify:CR=1 FL=1|jgi:hypothetical protein|nr:hypothetical protein [Elusimicrobiota bacterium]MBK7207606.1 hypothetical protein [Elusimicrobiota bacterium]MBK7544376.1 hypothetical protein [Elusimicrobiota bacterium]MBK7573898.1 hypothetical protein [Elusimicrobiota bacterium]MBK7689496.1 hypothetical protein [Elusimicrobiota bacterium]
MKTTVHILIPFDLGLELDFEGADAKAIAKEISSRPIENLMFGGRAFTDVRLTVQIYKFGVGQLGLTFDTEGDLDVLATLSCRAEALTVGARSITEWAHSRVDEVIAGAKRFASHAYDRRLEDVDPFPVFVFEKGAVADATEFITKNQKALTGIVSGEPNYDALSDFVLEQEKLRNFGYYENELILIKRFGAVVSSEESNTILELIRLAYSLFWSLRSYNFLLEKEIDQAQSVLAKLPPYYKFWSMPSSYQRFSREAMDFVRDKLAIVDSLHNVQTNIPRIDSDWHLRTIYKNVEKEFDIDELSKAVDTKLERIEQSYNSARDFISTNFFIAVEIVLILSLVWMMLDTSLLFIIAQK